MNNNKDNKWKTVANRLNTTLSTAKVRYGLPKPSILKKLRMLGGTKLSGVEILKAKAGRPGPFATFAQAWTVYDRTR